MGALTPDAVPLSPWQLRLSVKSKVPLGHKPATSPMQFQTATIISSLKSISAFLKSCLFSQLHSVIISKNYGLTGNYLKGIWLACWVFHMIQSEAGRGICSCLSVHALNEVLNFFRLIRKS